MFQNLRVHFELTIDSRRRRFLQDNVLYRFRRKQDSCYTLATCPNKPNGFYNRFLVVLSQTTDRNKNNHTEEGTLQNTIDFPTVNIL